MSMPGLVVANDYFSIDVWIFVDEPGHDCNRGVVQMMDTKDELKLVGVETKDKKVT